MPITGVRNVTDYWKRMRGFVEKEAKKGNNFTISDLVSATQVPYGFAATFLRLSHRRGELTRIKRKGKLQRCYHYSLSEIGLCKETVAKGEIADLVWQELKNQLPEAATMNQIKGNVRLRSGKDYHRGCVERLIRNWFLSGHLEKIEGEVLKKNAYKIKPEWAQAFQRPVVKNAKGPEE